MSRVTTLVLAPVAGSLLLEVLLALAYDLRGLALPEFAILGLLVGATVGLAQTRVLGQSGPRALPWVAAAALTWALAAVLHDQLTALAQHGSNPFGALDWSVRTSPEGAPHPMGRTFYGREAFAGLLAGLGSGLPMLAHLPMSLAQRSRWWLVGGALTSGTWMLSLHSAWLS